MNKTEFSGRTGVKETPSVGNKIGFWRGTASIACVIAGFVAAPSLAIAQESDDREATGNSKVIPRNNNAYGNTYGEWTARWWQWLISVPENNSSNLDPTGANCGQAQTGPVWFLGGTFGGSATRNCTVPLGKALFFPILNTMFGEGVGDCTGPNDCDPTALRKAAAGDEKPAKTLIARIDGKAVTGFRQFEVTSPVFNVFAPAGAVLRDIGMSQGTHGPLVSDGFWVLVRPVSFAYPPAKPGALVREPLKAARRGR